jgi:hypothetical protein
MAAKNLRTCININPLLKSESLSANKKIILYKALIGSITTYGCPAWEFAIYSYLLK